MRKMGPVLAALTLSVQAGSHLLAQGQAPQPMSFFITSVGSGNGANLGGLLGADKHCQNLASAVGSTKMWRAYLSEIGSAGRLKPVNARDRIGTGPWYNAKGVLIANNAAELHSDKNNITKQTALTEKGAAVNGRTDTPNRHDILTGSHPDGTAIEGPSATTTCGNWVRSFPGTGSAMVGHHDRDGLGENAKSWNAAHQSKGCSQAELQASGGDGLFYCFAVN